MSQSSGNIMWSYVKMIRIVDVGCRVVCNTKYVVLRKKVRCVRNSGVSPDNMQAWENQSTSQPASCRSPAKATWVADARLASSASVYSEVDLFSRFRVSSICLKKRTW